METASYDDKCAALIREIAELEQEGFPEEQIKTYKNVQNSHAVQLQAGKLAVFQDLVHLSPEMPVHFRSESRSVILNGDKPLPGVDIALDTDMPGRGGF